MSKNETSFSVWQAFVFPHCDLCDTRIHDRKLRYAVRMMRDGKVFMARAPKPIECFGCGEPYDTIFMFKTVREAESWAIKTTTPGRRKKRVPVIEIDAYGEPLVSEDVVLVF